VVLGKAAFGLLREEQLAVGLHLEHASGRGDENERGDVVLAGFKQGGRQTDGPL
jgi:hypothetical protein